MSGDWSLLSAASLGLAFGLKQALDADHLAAVSVIVSEKRSFWRSSSVGALWGLGHSFSLLAVAVLVIVAEIRIPSWAASTLELAVAIMLIGLGVNAVFVLWRGGTVHMHAHRHGRRLHVHPHVHLPGQPSGEMHHNVPFATRSLLVGAVHGLAGSAALMLLVLATLPSSLLGFAYIIAFAIGSTAGMFLMTLMVSLPLRLAAQRFTRAYSAVRLSAALGSICTGVWLALVSL